MNLLEGMERERQSLKLEQTNLIIIGTMDSLLIEGINSIQVKLTIKQKEKISQTWAYVQTSAI